MIQILGIRSFYNKDGELITYDAFHNKGWRAPSVQAIFENPNKFLAVTPENERWNLFYTLATCTEQKREFQSQSVLAFDIDAVDYSRLDDTIACVLKSLGLDKEKTGIAASGNGLHIIIELEKPFRNRDFFKLNKHHYKGIIAKINKALEKEGLQGKADPAIFDSRRILRYPNTINRKPNKPEKKCEVLRGVIKPQGFSLHTLSDIPDIKPQDQVSQAYLKRYPNVDTAAILEGCEFLKWMKEKPGFVLEPQWYAGLSILARLPDGSQLCHAYSEGHEKYSHAETNVKINQALEASGPRTCENIQDVWGECPRCVHFQRIKSPIMLRGENTLETENTGFYHVMVRKSGEIKLTPCYDDLIKFFAQKYQFVTLKGTRIVYVWTGTHFEVIENSSIENFAITHFNPTPQMSFVREFRDRVCILNERPLEAFEKNCEGKANFLNGVLDVKTMVFGPHSPDFYFRFVLDFNYEPESISPNFDKMMKKITIENEELEKVLEEFGGFSIFNATYYPHKALVLVGDGANGKTTFLNVLQAIAGRKNFCGLSLLDIQTSEYNRQLLDGKLFNISEETSIRSFADSSTFKKLVGEGILQVRKPYKDTYEIQNRAKLIITCNELPTSHDYSHGFMRRLLVVPFRQRFSVGDPDFDPDIEVKIKEAELPGVFNCLLRGYRRLKKQGSFTKSSLITQRTEEYAQEIDTVRRYVSENIVYLPDEQRQDKFLLQQDLYDAYKIHTTSELQRPLTAIHFGRRLRKCILDFDKRFAIRKVEGKTIKGFWGLDIQEMAGLTLTE